MPYTFENLVRLPTREKFPLFNRNEKIFHLLFAEQLNRQTLEFLFRLATTLRKIAKSNEGMGFLKSLLSHKSAMLYFTQPSTRTYLSFVRACQYLGMDYAEVRDPRISSFSKGESAIDGVRTFSSYFDLIIMRYHEGGFAERIAYMMNNTNRAIPVISGGAGPDEHPTQALLDIYTLKLSFEQRPKNIDGIHIAFVGDVARGRTIRSLAKLLTRYDDVKMTFISPPELKIKKDLRDFLEREHIEFYETNTLSQAIKEVDAVYIIRIQDEYDGELKSANIDYTPFYLTIDLVEQMKPSSIIMHPLPRRDELDPKIDLNPRARYWEQERNGMWIRAALIAYIFNSESKILDYYSLHYKY